MDLQAQKIRPVWLLCHIFIQYSTVRFKHDGQYTGVGCDYFCIKLIL